MNYAPTIMFARHEIHANHEKFHARISVQQVFLLFLDKDSALVRTCKRSDNQALQKFAEFSWFMLIRSRVKCLRLFTLSMTLFENPPPEHCTPACTSLRQVSEMMSEIQRVRGGHTVLYKHTRIARMRDIYAVRAFTGYSPTWAT
jgi:hypothetical protein